jgi:hypothetical protein
MAFPPAARNYLLKALTGNPAVLAKLLEGIASNDPIWDQRPDPERFTLREVLAHWADWEPIWKGRFERLRDEDNPLLESIDEGQLVIDNDYANQDPIANVQRFAEGRVELVALLASLNDSDWNRPGHREFVGDITILSLATLILSHDGYHMHQVVQWLDASA